MSITKKLIKKSRLLVKTNNKEALLLFYLPAGNPQTRVNHIVNNVSRLPERKIKKLADKILYRFGKRHKKIDKILLAHFNNLKKHLDKKIINESSYDKKLLLASYFTKEYTYKSTAYCNPSITLAPNQENLKNNELRYILSIRAIGEEHISCCAFHGLIIDKNNNIFLEYAKYKTIPKTDKIEKTDYLIHFEKDTQIEERVIYPVTANEQHGIEDVRWSRFSEDNKSFIYYGTYTAYDGIHITPKIFITSDFTSFKSVEIKGKYAKNKNMALFPRKINSKYAMIARLDGINMDIMYSDNPFIWNEKPNKIQDKFEPWEFTQSGSNGAPLETKNGWLIITHGVGPIREYGLSIKLLDLNDPTKVIGRIKQPLLLPNAKERNGYVPNVVYSCGCIIHNDALILPYAYSDLATKYVEISLDRLVSELVSW